MTDARRSALPSMGRIKPAAWSSEQRGSRKQQGDRGGSPATPHRPPGCSSGLHSGARPRGSCSVSPRTVLTERRPPTAAGQHPSLPHYVLRLAGNGERGSWNRSPSRGTEDEVTLRICIITVDLFSTSDSKE